MHVHNPYPIYLAIGTKAKKLRKYSYMCKFQCKKMLHKPSLHHPSKLRYKACGAIVGISDFAHYIDHWIESEIVSSLNHLTYAKHAILSFKIGVAMQRYRSSKFYIHMNIEKLL